VDSVPSDIDLLDREYAFRGRLIALHVDRIRFPDGKEATREVVAHPGAVAVVALPEPGSVLLVQQYRHPIEGLLWEIPAGKLESGESPLACAKRELLEETSFFADRWQGPLPVYTTPGFSDERISLFLATSLRRVTTPPDADVVRCASVSAKQLQTLLDRGELIDAKTLLGLLWFGLLRPAGGGIET